jgi:hypothetical protein
MVALYQIACQNCLHLKRKLSRNPDLKAEYVKFTNKLHQLDHMEPASSNTSLLRSEYQAYFMPQILSSYLTARLPNFVLCSTLWQKLVLGSHLKLALRSNKNCLASISGNISTRSRLISPKCIVKLESMTHNISYNKKILSRNPLHMARHEESKFPISAPKPVARNDFYVDDV